MAAPGDGAAASFNS